MRLPRINQIPTSELTTDTFAGLHHNERCTDTYMYDMSELNADKYPSLSTRKRYKTILNQSSNYVAPVETDDPYDPIGNYYGDKKLIVGMTSYGNRLIFLIYEETSASGFVDDDAVSHLHVYGHDADGNTAPQLLGSFDSDVFPGPVQRRLVIMGAYLLIFEDNLYFNLTDEHHTDKGVLRETKRYKDDEESLNIELELVKGPSGNSGTGTFYFTGTEPQNTVKGDIWCDVTQTPNVVKRRWTVDGQLAWQSWGPYVKVTEPAIDGLAVGDKIWCYGFATAYNGQNGSLLTCVNAEQRIFIGNFYADTNAVDGQTASYRTATGTYKQDGEYREIKFPFECNNRLWGCHIIDVDGKRADEIFCSELGNFRSFVPGADPANGFFATRGLGGKYTGAINYNGTPTFFKENCMIKVVGNEPANFSLTEIACDGVADQAEETLAVINGVLYYRSIRGIAYYDGTIPHDMSDALGDLLRDNGEAELSGIQARAAGFKGKYYAQLVKGFFVYDTHTGFWTCYSDLGLPCSCATGLFAYRLDGVNHRIYIRQIEGQTGTPDETSVTWYAETGLIGISVDGRRSSTKLPEQKYINKIKIRLRMSGTATLKVKYNDDEDWTTVKSLAECSMKTQWMCFVPRRCEAMRIRLEGTGAATIISITKTMERGSDVV